MWSDAGCLGSIPKAFSDRVDTGWTQGNATKQEEGAVDLMPSDRKPL
jgi:hypothetical protein